ncbi:hypothetical protein TFLX_02175 [Thermoflexales bacterium]|nr:hypothetical protein TFLX_02175 [Thermoflexales bacterium]
MANSEADFLKIEIQLHFLEAAMADTAFVVSHLLKDLNNPGVADDRLHELQASEHRLRTLLHQIRACAQQEIETEEQAHAGQRLYDELLQEFKAATHDFTDHATALAASLPSKEQVELQASLSVLSDFEEGFSSLS